MQVLLKHSLTRTALEGRCCKEFTKQLIQKIERHILFLMNVLVYINSFRQYLLAKVTGLVVGAASQIPD